MADETPEQSYFRDWLSAARNCGCGFAALVAGSASSHLFYDVLEFTPEVATEVAGFLDDAGERSRVAIIFAPTARTENEIIALIQAVSAHERWTVRVRDDLARDPDEVGVQMTWTTEAGDSTDAMGFAPTGHMPLSRRAPFTALVVWTGGHENPHRAKPIPGMVGVGDSPPVKPEVYDSTMMMTKTRSQVIRSVDGATKGQLRQLAFRVHASRARLFS